MEQLKQEAKQIRDESLANQNTATRVGGWMVRLLERLQGKQAADEVAAQMLLQ